MAAYMYSTCIKKTFVSGHLKDRSPHGQIRKNGGFLWPHNRFTLSFWEYTLYKYWVEWEEYYRKVKFGLFHFTSDNIPPIPWIKVTQYLFYISDTTADPGGGQRGPWPPQKKRSCTPPPPKKKKKKKKKKGEKDRQNKTPQLYAPSLCS